MRVSDLEETDLAVPATGTPEASASRLCVSCGAVRSGLYCAECGQRELRERHSLRSMLVTGLGRITNFDSGLLHTAHRLTVSPGQVIREYLAGRTNPYTHPVGYLLIAFAAFAVMARAFGGAVGGEGDRIYWVLLVPFVAAASRALFWPARLNYAEHLILVMYVAGHSALCFAILFVGMSLTNDAVDRTLGFAALILGVVYIAWVYSRVFTARPLLAAAGGLIALAVGTLSWTLALVSLLELFFR